jgi:Alpha amylase, catalytic domain
MINDLWYKNSIVYCLSVSTFMDSNGDGVGDFQGLARRLDYLQGLGVTTLWLMPFQTLELVHDAVPKPTASLPFRPSMARASAGVATSRDSSSRIRLILRTCSALDLAIWPLPR